MSHVRPVKSLRTFYIAALEYLSAPDDLKPKLLEEIPGRHKRARGSKVIEVRRYTKDEDIEGNWGYTGGGEDGLQFTCSAPVLILGVSLLTPQTKPSTKAKIRLLRSTGKTLATLEVTYGPSPEKMTKATFKEPIPLEGGVTYSIIAKITGGISARVKPALARVKAAGVTFIFSSVDEHLVPNTNGTTCTNGQFPIFHFKTI